MAYKLGFAGSRANLWDCKVELLCRLLESWYIPTTWTQHFSTVHHNWFNASNNPTCSKHVCIPSQLSHPTWTSLWKIFSNLHSQDLPKLYTPLIKAVHVPNLSWDENYFYYFIGSNLFQCQFVWKLIIEHLWILVNYAISWSVHRISPWLTAKKHHKWIQMGCPVSKPR